jgi:crotonobetainyl-CoA:carnitine CoA-transferase CaiB-like acyl-CoA transferase
MQQFAATGVAAALMPERISAWAVYDVFTLAGGAQMFIAATGDAQIDALAQAGSDLQAGLRHRVPSTCLSWKSYNPRPRQSGH